ncbi:acyl-CoA dehydrogenase/oxidase [Aspergillus venezuelensis]
MTRQKRHLEIADIPQIILTTSDCHHPRCKASKQSKLERPPRGGKLYQSQMAATNGYSERDSASAILNIDVVERDSASKEPFAEVQLLKDAGLVNLLGPRKYGGVGEIWQTSYKITSEIAKADASIGHLLGNHYSFWSSQILGTPKQAERWLRELTEGSYYLGSAVNSRNADMVAEVAGLDLVFNGDKFFSTGGVISDFTVLEGVLQGGTHVFAYVPTKCAGIIFKGDWDYILEGYGRLQAKIWATEVLVDRTAERVSEAIHAPRETLTKDTRGKLPVQVAASKAQAIETALEVSSKIFEFVGASGSLSKYGFDRFWRNTRVHSLHDPIAYKFREVGSWALLNKVPEPSWYTQRILPLVGYKP